MTLYEAACTASRKSAVGFAHPVAVMGFPISCWAWFWFGGDEMSLTLVLSVLAISTTQLVLLAQDRDTRAIHAKLDELLRGVPAADEKLAGIERQP